MVLCRIISQHSSVQESCLFPCALYKLAEEIVYLRIIEIIPIPCRIICHFSSDWLLSSFQSHSCVWFFAIPWTATYQTSLSITNSWSLLKLLSIELVMPSNHLILCCYFSSHLQSFPAWGSFLNSQFFTSGGQSIGISASASILPMNIQDWFPLGLTGLISLISKGLSRVFPIPQFKSINSLVLILLYGQTLTSIHDYWKNHLTRQILVSQVMPLFFNMLSRFVIAFLPRSVF